MALFFDARWFDERLAARGLDRDAVAALFRCTRDEIDDLFKDQREMMPHEVRALAELIGEPIPEVVNRAGVATPEPVTMPDGSGIEARVLVARLDELNGRMEHIERAIVELKSLILELRDR